MGRPLVLLVILSSVILISEAQDYCKICSNHVACLNPSAQLGAKCPSDAKVIDFTAAQKQVILDAHNEYRNAIANGGYGYKKAVKMAEVSWNSDLAYLAKLNVMKCEFEHDKCFKTTAFPQAGQNIYEYSSWPACTPVDDQIKASVKSWFDEYKDATTANIASYPSFTSKDIGHFTQIVKDDSAYLGCAMIQFMKDEWCQIIVTCNYAKTNIIGKPIYKDGATTASECVGVSSRYSGLCSK